VGHSPIENYRVAHSLRGVLANLYARTYPNDILGLVFVDATHPGEIAENKVNESPFVIKFINDILKSIKRKYDKFKYSEDECINDTVIQIENAKPFLNVSVPIISGGDKLHFLSVREFFLHQ
jgi:pimeloyl-ACP methyl ester carboxylesterase